MRLLLAIRDGIWIPWRFEPEWSIPPITVGAGATLEHRIRVFGGFPALFAHQDPEGTYRLVLFPVNAFESNAFPFGVRIAVRDPGVERVPAGGVKS